MSEMMKRAAIYMRVGSLAQLNDQVINSKRIYHDTAASVSLRDREELNKMLDAAREKGCDVVLINDLSRLPRNNAHLILIQGIPVLAVVDNLDTPDVDSKLAYQMKGILNEVYIDDLRKKTLRGLLGQKILGFFVGEKTYGYKSEPFGNTVIGKKGRARSEGYKMYILSEEAVVIRIIFTMYDEGMSINKIVKILNYEGVASSKLGKNGWTMSTVYRILGNEKYIGIWAWGKLQNKRGPITGVIRKVKRTEPLFVATYEELRIIPQDLWERTQKRLRCPSRSQHSLQAA